jgi:hypothetical protein
MERSQRINTILSRKQTTYIVFVIVDGADHAIRECESRLERLVFLNK